MYLQEFPMDKQFCPLQFGSYAYPDSDVIYVWKRGATNSVLTASDMQLSQFDLLGHPANNITVITHTGNFCSLSVQFHLVRHLGYFVFQLYLPCTLVVVLSWVSFWLNREATADRVGLGVTTFLTLTTLSLEGRSSLPVVPYATALDWFIALCFIFIFASIPEFTSVHYFNYGDPPVSDSEDDQENIYTISALTSGSTQTWMMKAGLLPPASGNGEQKQECRRDSCLMQFMRCLQSNIKYKHFMVARGESRNRGQVNTVSIIDRVSRYAFPTSLIVLYTLYWVSYL